MITKQHKWFAELYPARRTQLLEKFAKQNHHLFTSFVNYEYSEREELKDPDIFLHSK